MENKTVYIETFCKENNLVFAQKSECGFGRPCVGILSPESDNYIEYNPTHAETYKPIDGTHSDKHYEFAPADAYHKHDCFAVLAHDENYDEAISQLYDWISKIVAYGYEVRKFNTGATGIQAMVSGTHNYCIVLTPTTPNE